MTIDFNSIKDGSGRITSASLIAYLSSVFGAMNSDIQSRIGSVGGGYARLAAASGDRGADITALNIVVASGGGATIYEASTAAGSANPIGVSIPAGSSGAGSQIIAYPLTRADEIASLAGMTIEIAATYDATAGMASAIYFTTPPVSVNRNASVGGAIVESTQAGLVLTRRASYTVTGTETSIGLVTQIANTSPVMATAQTLTLRSVTYAVVAAPQSAQGAGGETLSRAIAAQAAGRGGVSVVEEIGDTTGALAAQTSWLTDTLTGYVNGWTIPSGQYGGATYINWVWRPGPRDLPLLRGATLRVTILCATSADYARIISPVVYASQASGAGAPLANHVVKEQRQVTPTLRRMVVEGGFDVGGAYMTVVLQNARYSGGAAVGDIVTTTTDTMQVTDIRVEIVAPPAGSGLRAGDMMARLAANRAARQARQAMTVEAALRAARVTVGPTGRDYTTVAAALAAVTPGSKLALDPVAYPETLVYPTIPDLTIETAGHGGRAAITFAQADSTALAYITAKSAMDLRKSIVLRALRVTTKNGRYAIHSDGSNHDRAQSIVLEDCHLEHLGNDGAVAYQTSLGAGGNPAGVMTSKAAFGLGVSDGCEIVARRCTFVGHNFDAVYSHNWGAFAAPARMLYEDCVFDPQPVAGSTGRANAISYNNLGSGTPDALILRGCQLGGPVMCGSWPWQGATLSQIPAYKMTMQVTGSRNTPAAYVLDDDGSRALTITSATTGAASLVVVSGSAVAVLMGEATRLTVIAGDVGLAGAVRGWLDVGDHSVGPSGNVAVNMAARLGNLGSSTLTLTVAIDGGAPININFTGDYTSATTNSILATINAALGASATAALINVNDLFRPLMTDEEVRVVNTSSSTILRKMAVAYNGTRQSGRLMTASDDASLFAGIAYEDIRPGKSGRVKSAGRVRVSMDMLRSDSGAFVAGDQFGVGATAGQWVKSPAIPLLEAVNTLDVQFGMPSAIGGAAWTSFSPTVTSVSGTLGGYTINTARYRKSGKTIHVEIDVTITSVGTASGLLRIIGLPQCSQAQFTGIGREGSLTGKGVLIFMTAGAVYATAAYYDNTSPIAANARLAMSITYEAA